MLFRSALTVVCFPFTSEVPSGDRAVLALRRIHWEVPARDYALRLRVSNTAALSWLRREADARVWSHARHTVRHRAPTVGPWRT